MLNYGFHNSSFLLRPNSITGEKTFQKVAIDGNFNTNGGKINNLDIATNLVSLDGSVGVSDLKGTYKFSDLEVKNLQVRGFRVLTS